DFLDFLGDDSKLIIHNAEFDMKFINAEIKTYGFASIDPKRVVDTLAMARKKFPGSPANLDALCRRFNIDNSNRTLHGALLDSELLAEVYLELLGGRQRGLEIDVIQEECEETVEVSVKKERVFRKPRQFDVSAQELEAHQKMMDDLKDPIWKKIN
ncbi:MAG: DNA polymerase III subunit epsilon, partial [Phototrophicales bacterium]